MSSTQELQEILAKESPKKVFLVVDEAYEKSGAKEKFSAVLTPYEAEVFSDIMPNPSFEQIEKGIEAFRNSGADFVVAIGGGSVLDTAKAVNLLAAQEGNPFAYMAGEMEITRSGKPLVAVPTTVGTGAEITPFAVMYAGKIKHSLSHAFLLPSYAIVDAELTYSMPPKITADTGMDALSQAIEAFWSMNATEESRKYSMESMELILENLALATNNPSPESREAMAKGAHMSGKAIAIAKTTACHAL